MRRQGLASDSYYDLAGPAADAHDDSATPVASAIRLAVLRKSRKRRSKRCLHRNSGAARGHAPNARRHRFSSFQYGASTSHHRYARARRKALYQPLLFGMASQHSCAGYGGVMDPIGWDNARLFEYHDGRLEVDAGGSHADDIFVPCLFQSYTRNLAHAWPIRRIECGECCQARQCQPGAGGRSSR